MKYKIFLSALFIFNFFTVMPCFKVRKHKSSLYKSKNQPSKKPSTRDLKKEYEQHEQEWQENFWADILNNANGKH